LTESGKSSTDTASVTLKDSGGIKTGVSLRTVPSSAKPDWSDLSSSGRDLGVQQGVASIEAKQPRAFSAFMSGNTFYASLSLLNERLNEIKDSIYFTSSPQSLWYKFAYTPTIAGLNLAMGVFGETTRSAQPSGPSTDVYGRASLMKADSIGLDAQAQGTIGGLMVNLKAMYMNSGSSYATPPLNGETRILSSVSDGYGASTRIGVKSFGLNAAYRTYKGTSGNAEAFENAASIGADFNIANKITLKSQYTSYGTSLDNRPQDGAFSLWLISGF
jgi:hypothetical protein